MRAAVLLAALALAGCAAKTVTVQVPVPCTPPPIDVPDLHEWDRLPAEAPIDDQVLALFADRTRATGYIGQLEAAVAACR